MITRAPVLVLNQNYQPLNICNVRRAIALLGKGKAEPIGETGEFLRSATDLIEKPVIILTGDVHHPFAVQITDNVWEFLCSPMNSANHPIGTAGPTPASRCG